MGSGENVHQSGLAGPIGTDQAHDLLVMHGGTAMLSETPEVYGAEHLLTRRAVSREVGEKLVKRIKWWEDYTERLGGEMNNNPSPGNKAGGLTTITEKSLGAVSKSGSTGCVSPPDVGVGSTCGKLDGRGNGSTLEFSFGGCSKNARVATL